MTPLSAVRRWFSRPAAVWYHPSYRLPLASSVGAPMSPRRADDALTWALDAGVLEPSDVHEAAEISWDDAGLVHGEAYLASLDRPAVVARILGADEPRVAVREILETWRRATGATLAAARHVVRDGGRAVNLLGGFHHAERDKGGGFCALNDVAVAVACLRRDGVRGRIGIIDLDAHPPDGIADCLRDDEQVDLLSLSTASAWTLPVGTAATVVDSRVPAGSGDHVYLWALDALIAEFPAFEVAFYLAGADPLAGDKLGGLSVSEDGLRERDRRVLTALGRTPTVILPAGGYSEGSWRVLATTVALASGRSAAVRRGYDPLLRRTRTVMHTLDPRVLAGGGDALVTEEELLGSLGVGVPTSEPRFLGYYTRHGLEHALVAYGYLTTLRRLGFSDLGIELTSGHGAPDRMRVSGAVGGVRVPLVDLAASIRTIDTFRALFVEWLELKDPRSTFTTGRPKLPGQEHPGLGMAEETLQILVRAAERLALHGVSFVPAHYHVAWMSRDRFVIVDPEARGRFAVMREATRDLPLLEATRKLGGAGLVADDGQHLKWEPVEMVSVLDPGLQAFLDAGDVRAQEVAETWRARLGLPQPS